ncbi:MAG: SPOR domain-containing protein, partial [Nitrospinota bacterium]|nr:SPOR domain-containing protein [Nitrospinota bacterium]
VKKLPYAVSLGSFKSEAEAYEIIRNFRKKRYSPYLFSVGDVKEIIHHVLVGEYENEGRVNKVSNILSEKGVAHTVIQP